MLGLGQQIDGDAARVVVGIGDHDDLRRAGDVVDADAAEHLALGLGDIGVAGSDDAVHRRRWSRCRKPAPPPPGRRRCGRSRSPRPGAPRPAPAGSAPRPGVGTHIAIRPTPATRAGMAFISTEDGYAALPPGTYSPTASSAPHRMPMVTPGGVGHSQILRSWARWNASIRAAARSSARRKSAGIDAPPPRSRRRRYAAVSAVRVRRSKRAV